MWLGSSGFKGASPLKRYLYTSLRFFLGINILPGG